MDIRRTAVEREATYLELVGLETDAKRRVAQRARVVRDALVDTPALADALRRAGVLDDDDALGALAAGLMAAPLHDPPGDQPLGDRVSAAGETPAGFTAGARPVERTRTRTRFDPGGATKERGGRRAGGA